MCVNTIVALKVLDEDGNLKVGFRFKRKTILMFVIIISYVTIIIIIIIIIVITNVIIIRPGQDNPLLAMTETICIVWFSLEYVLRLIGAPDKKVILFSNSCKSKIAEVILIISRQLFLMNGLNFVDVLAILPYFVEVITRMTNKQEFEYQIDK